MEEMEDYSLQYNKEDLEWNLTKEELHDMCLRYKLYYFKKIEYNK